MSKPRDPVLAVLKYFETADIALARQALAMAQEVLRQRAPKGNSKPKESTKRKNHGPGVSDSALIS